MTEVTLHDLPYNLSRFPVIVLYWRYCAPRYLNCIAAVLQLAVLRSSGLGAPQLAQFFETLYIVEFRCINPRLFMVLWWGMMQLGGSWHFRTPILVV